MTTKIEAVKTVFATAAQAQAEIKTQAEAQMNAAREVDNSAEAQAFKAQFQRAATHEKFNAALSSMSDKAVQVMNRYKIDAEALSNQSRELKKRSIAILEAIATNSFVQDKALDAVLNVLAAKKSEKLTISTIQNEMQHDTDTQASYFKRCAVFFKFAQYSASDKAVVFNYDAAVLRDLMNIYTAHASVDAE
jgi:sugar-specific transcriptional regulator TrmB